METKKFIIESCEIGKRLDVFILENVENLSRSHIKTLIENGNVLYNNKIVKSGTKLKLGDCVCVNLPQEKTLDLEPENIELDIVYEDDDVVVINKPQGMVVHPANGNWSGTLVNALLYSIKNLSAINGVVRPGIVHRIDKNTSGLIIVAKNDFAHKSLALQISTKTCKREYLAICSGVFKNESDIVQFNIGRSDKDRKKMAVKKDGSGKVSVTEYQIVKQYSKYALVEFKLKTGRTHQIRVCCKYLNHGILGDVEYGVLDKKFDTKGQMLHAYKLVFVQPRTQKQIEVTCPLPEYFENILSKL